jgi:hypothetical protein
LGELLAALLVEEAAVLGVGQQRLSVLVLVKAIVLSNFYKFQSIGNERGSKMR